MKGKIGLVVMFVVLVVLLVGCSSEPIKEDAVVGVVDRLISVAREVSPLMWGIARQRVVAMSIQAAFGVLASVAALVLSIFGIRWASSKDAEYHEDMQMVIGIPSIAGVVAMPIAIIALSSELIGYLVSPDYTALKVLLDLIPK